MIKNPFDEWDDLELDVSCAELGVDVCSQMESLFEWRKKWEPIIESRFRRLAFWGSVFPNQQPTEVHLELMALKAGIPTIHDLESKAKKGGD